MNTRGRDRNGQFAQGNAGGPGRPRRAIEREYLAVLGDAVTLDNWRDVVARAVVDAKAGDSTARAWLTKYLLGETPPCLMDLAAMEQRGATADDEVREVLIRQEQDAKRQAKYDAIMAKLH